MDSGAVVKPPHVAGPLSLQPFRALRLAPFRVGDPASGRIFARPEADLDARLARWAEHGQITQDPRPAVYLHEYTANGITVRGLVGLVDVSRRAHDVADRAIHPHEGIYPAQADDLAARMERTRLNPAPILLVHRGTTGLRAVTHEVMTRPVTHELTDRHDQQHRIWTIEDPATVDRVNAELVSARALIADGHHRYAAYLRLQQREPGGPADRGLAMLVDQGDTPLFLGAIHRVLTGCAIEDFTDACRAVGLHPAEVTEAEAISSLGPRTLVATDTGRWSVLRLEEPTGRAVVEVLHDDVVPALARGPARVGYHHSVEDALARVSPGQGVAVLMPAADVDEVLRIVGRARLLPEKATSFQPKPTPGVLIRSWRDG